MLLVCVERKVFEDTKNFQSVPARETVTEPKAAVPCSCVNTAEAKLDKSRKVNIFANFSFRPRGNNTKDQGGKQEENNSQKKTGGSSKTQGSQSDKDRGTKDPKDPKDPKSGGLKLK